MKLAFRSLLTVSLLLLLGVGRAYAQDHVPGEEKEIAPNKKAKVWTTQGPVPVHRAPELNDATNAGVSTPPVIVDYSNQNSRRRDTQRRQNSETNNSRRNNVANEFQLNE